MNKIDKLIDEMCPQGVEFRALGEVCQISAGGDLPENYIKGQDKPSEEFQYPIYSNGSNEKALYGYTDNYKIDKDAVTISARGTIGYHSVRRAKFTPIVRLITLIPSIKIITVKFLNYVLDITAIGHSGGSIPQLTVPNVKKIKIPIPPLTIQKEIVKILDNFTRLEAELEAYLEADLEVRRKQYEYYREELLRFGDDVEFRTLGEICKVTSGGTPSKSKIEFWAGGVLPWLKSESCNNKPIYQATNFITDLGLLKSSAKLIKKNATLMALVGATIFKTAYLEFDSTTNQNIASIKSKDELILKDKFTFYYLTNLYGELKNKMKDYGMLNLTTLRKIKIPIPPLPEQNRIVAILDKFDTLVNDISTGLPAEITARKKQYEYYRNQLLTFKKMVDMESAHTGQKK
jgi:type I restriction enzyme, S subunit